MPITFEKIILLKNMPIFQEVNENALTDLAALSQEETFKAGSIIIPKETINTYFYIILSGTVHINENENKFIELGPRQFFGETTLFAPALLPYDIMAFSNVNVLKINKENLYKIMALHYSFFEAFMQMIARKMQY